VQLQLPSSAAQPSHSRQRRHCFGSEFFSVQRTAVANLTLCLVILLVGTAHAYRFEDLCPTQSPPNWPASSWTQFRESCIADDSAGHRPLFDKCMTECAVANEKEGRIPPNRASAGALSGSVPNANPNWCSDVPASPAPPHFELHPGVWAAIRNACINTAPGDRVCSGQCSAAEELWRRAKAGQLGAQQQQTYPYSSDQPHKVRFLYKEERPGIFYPYRQPLALS